MTRFRDWPPWGIVEGGRPGARFTDNGTFSLRPEGNGGSNRGAAQ